MGVFKGSFSKADELFCNSFFLSKAVARSEPENKGVHVAAASFRLAAWAVCYEFRTFFSLVCRNLCSVAGCETKLKLKAWASMLMMPCLSDDFEISVSFIGRAFC